MRTSYRQRWSPGSLITSWATGSLDAVTATWLRISGDAATGDGGTCYGDSGGPKLLGDFVALP